ncbi:MAG: restriction endonuclease subunit S, partial [Proteobacteria bacterium]
MTAIQKLLTDHIDIWTALETDKKSGQGRASGNAMSVYGIKKLRELILELAVRGKLVPQDASDEPASALLNRVQITKEQLITERKIRSKQLLKISDHEKLFDIPRNWEWTRIGSIGTIKGGKRLPAGTAFSSSPTPFIYVQVTNMKNGTIIEENLKYIDEDTQKIIKQYTISSKDIYITIAGTIGDVGDVPDRFDGMNLTENAAKIVFDVLNKEWLIKALRSRTIKTQFTDKAIQMAQPKLALHRIGDSVLAIPPIQEQHRIVAKVDELMALCDQLEAQHRNAADAHEQIVSHLLAILTRSQSAADFNSSWQRIAAHFDSLFTTESSIDALKQTLLQLAVMGKLVAQDPNDDPARELLKRIKIEKEQLLIEARIKAEKEPCVITPEEQPFSIPSSWEWVRLGTISSAVQYGYTDSADHESRSVLFLRITDIQNDSVNWATVPGCSISITDSKNCALENGDIVIARTGGTIGKSYLVTGLNQQAVFASYLIRIGNLSSTSPEYKKLFLGSSLYWEQLIANSMGTGQP